jgi:sugar (pentulose or hexulose) kinase
MSGDLVLGIDSSTSACKAILWDFEGNPVAEGRASLAMSRPRPSWHEQSAESWWEAARLAISGAISGIDPGRIASACIANQRETFVPVDSSGYPLRPAILWMDERAGPLLKRLSEDFDAEKFRGITGKPLSGNLSFSKLAWLRAFQPEVFRRASRFLDVQAFLIYKLTGQFRTGWGSADPTGLFDMEARAWSGEILATIGLETGRLPEAFPPGAAIGEVSREASAACGLPRGLPLIAGTGDGQSAALGVGVSGPGECSLSLGTSVVSGTYSEHFRSSPAFRTTFGGIPGSFLLETVILGGTYTIDWLIKTLIRAAESSSAPETELENRASCIAPGSDGLVLVPYWNSAMNPYWDQNASGITVGWRGHHGPAHLYRAILEGLAFELRLHASGVESALGRRVDRFIASGGGSKSDLFCSIIASVTGKPVHRLESPEAAALGAGMLAAAGAGIFPGVAEAVQGMSKRNPRVFSPSDGAAARYDRLYEEVFVGLYPSLRSTLSRIAELCGNDSSHEAGHGE